MSKPKSIVILGASNTGKTAILDYYSHHTNCIEREPEPTLCASFYARGDSFCTWDMSGNPKWDKVYPMYCRAAQGFIVVFDVTNPATFNQAIGYIDAIKKHCSHPNPFIILVGNKIDLNKGKIDELKPEIESQKNRLISAGNNIVAYIETSAATGKNINTIFDTVKINFRQQMDKPIKKSSTTTLFSNIKETDPTDLEMAKSVFGQQSIINIRNNKR